MKSLLSILILLTIFSFSACSNNIYPGMGNSLHPSAQLVTNFSFKQLAGGIIVMRALLNENVDSFNFILDTGCGVAALDSTTCDKRHTQKQGKRK